ncbi:MAG: hypothetical protein AAF580_11965 [Pseudomonadota bacterium]
MVIKVLTVAAVLGVGAFVALGSAIADEWSGFYVGVDAKDGSLERLSIAPRGNGTFSYTVSSSKFDPCEATHPEAVLTAIGTPARGRLVVGQSVVWCGGRGGEALPLGDIELNLDPALGIVSYAARSDGRRVSLTRISVGPSPIDPWAGFYIGVDAADGSVHRTAIVPNRDGTYAIAVKSTAFSQCPAPNPAAVQTATGVVTDGKLVRTNTLRRCDGTGDPVTVGDVAYERDPQTGILSYPAPSDGRSVVAHRINK